MPTSEPQHSKLLPYERSAAAAGRVFTVIVDAEATALKLEYRLEGDLQHLSVPPPGGTDRRDGLWRHTCFELFIQLAGGQAYREYNFSPSGEWAAYDFSDYRTGMTQAEECAAPQAQWRSAPGLLELHVTVCRPARLPGVAQTSSAGQRPALKLGIAAVLEDEGGTLSHWALRHVSARPDFHHSAGFVIEPDT